MQLITSLFEKASYSMPSIINHKNILKPLMKPCWHKYIKYVAHKPARMHIHTHASSLFYDRDICKLTEFLLTFSFDTLTISKINRLADDIPLGCIDPIILVNACVWYLYDKHRYCEMHDKISTFTRTALHDLKSYVLSNEMNTLLYTSPDAITCNSTIALTHLFRAEGYHLL